MILGGQWPPDMICVAFAFVLGRLLVAKWNPISICSSNFCLTFKLGFGRASGHMLMPKTFVFDSFLGTHAGRKSKKTVLLKHQNK